MKIVSFLIMFFLLSCGHTHKHHEKEIPQAEVVPTLTDAYIYGLPLVLMDIRKEIQTNVERPVPEKMKAPINQFCHSHHYPTENDKGIIRPNVDTLYSNAWIDLSPGPLILEVPNTSDRYYAMPFMSGWGNVYASPGKRTTGTLPKKFMLVGPDWNGEVLEGVDFLRSPTNLNWIIGHIEVKDKEDAEKHVAKLQEEFKLYPASELGMAHENIMGKVNPFIKDESPVEKLFAMSTEEYFNRLNKLLKKNHPVPEDDHVTPLYSQVDIAPGAEFSLAKFSVDEQKAIINLPQTIRDQFEELKNQGGSLSNGWSIPRNIADYGTNYLKRALIAYVGLGEGLDADFLYPTASVDVLGDKLTGKKNYILHFETSELPPVRAFWSVTVYGPDSYLVKNSIHRHSLGSRSDLTYNKDGSLDIYIQHKSPGKKLESNWLPTPQNNFDVTARLFWPMDEALDPNWSMPPILPASRFKEHLTLNDDHKE